MKTSSTNVINSFQSANQNDNSFSPQSAVYNMTLNTDSYDDNDDVVLVETPKIIVPIRFIESKPQNLTQKSLEELKMNLATLAG